MDVDQDVKIPIVDINSPPYEPCTGCCLSVFKVTKICADVEKLKEFLISHGLLRDRIHCFECGHLLFMNWKQREFRCRKKNMKKKTKRKRCRFSRSIFKDTFFEFSAIPIEKVLLIVCYFALIPPPRQSFLANELKLSSSTIVRWMLYCRDVCVDFVDTEKLQIGGNNVIVEVGRSTIGSQKPWVIGGIEQYDKSKCFATVLSQFTKENVSKVLNEKLLPGTTILTDNSVVYAAVKNLGFPYMKTNHIEDNSYHSLKTTNAYPLQSIYKLWNDMRGNIPQAGVHLDQMNSYVAEFIFKRRFPKLSTRIHQLLILISESYAL